VRKLRSLDRDSRITLVAPQLEFVYLPSLIWIPSGIRQGSDLVVPLGAFLERMRVDSHAGKASGLRDGGRVVETGNGEVANDGLIIASGGRYIKKLPGIEHVLMPCAGIDQAESVRDRIRDMDGGTIAVGFGGNPQEPAGMRGGPMFEFLFGLHTQLRREGRRDRFRLVFFNPAPRPGQRLGPKAVDRLLAAMQDRDIETHLGHKMKGFEAGKVITEGGEFEADLILFLPGMTGAAWTDNTDLPRSPGGFIQADAQCRVTGYERTYVAGDAGSFPGPDWLPKQGHMADLQAEAAAENLLAELDGREPARVFKTELLCIVDSLDGGMLVRRTPDSNWVMPKSALLHWSKRLFEWWYLRRYRN